MDRMDSEFEPFLKDFSSESSATEEQLVSVERHYGRGLPGDYRTFMLTRDGGEGFIGEQYLILWKAIELVPFNREYEVDQYAPGLLLFGSSGGGEGFGFDLRTADMRVVMVPFIGMSWNHAIDIAPSFRSFLQKLNNGLNEEKR